MSELLSTQLLQDGKSPLGFLLATWLIWPILCGALGARKGEFGRGLMNGLLWGPFGLIFVLMAGQKYPCPTCGHKTLKTPAPIEARSVTPLTVPAPKPAIIPERRAPKPITKEEREKIVAAACAGYDADEESRLRSWLNNG